MVGKNGCPRGPRVGDDSTLFAAVFQGNPEIIKWMKEQGWYDWNLFLCDNEQILFTELITEQKFPFFSKKRQLILTTKQRLFFVDPIRMQQKEEITWSKNIYIQLKNPTTFDIVTPNRVYHITDSLQGAQWADGVEDSIIFLGFEWQHNDE